jgi:hypothetical protein
MLGYLAASAIRKPELLRHMANQLPEPMRSLCANLDYEAGADSLAFRASLDEALPMDMRPRLRKHDLLRMKLAQREIRYHLTPDGVDETGRWWHYATVARYLMANPTRKGLR